MKLQYSKQRAKPNISGAIPFRYAFTTTVNAPSFPEKKVSRVSLRILCEELDPLDNSYDSALSFLKSRAITIGHRVYIDDELKQGMKRSVGKYRRGFLVGFPFKCPVPFKTNYHNAPDLGEAMFLHRLGKICRMISKLSGKQFGLTIFEETQALLPVFNVDSKEAVIFRKGLHELLHLLKLNNCIVIEPLISFLAVSKIEYKTRLNKLAHKVKTVKTYKPLLDQILPTIALSINVNALLMLDSQKYIHNLFAHYVSEKKDRLLFETAYKYIAFILLQKESKFIEKYFSSFLHFSLCPKKGRISIYPTIKSARVWPHHGVPIVYSKNGKRHFLIEYYSDFVKEFGGRDIIRVVDQDNNFLYYQVQ
ncbi:MAG: L-tyrosine/L-tryptophan isonitrile synthase family protein [Candidatus Levybacteria bacterium]|nr:L-tyrosine/L-tryptophan isonitrile synthase family protein [Candidatus Levybacteria bacterium]